MKNRDVTATVSGAIYYGVVAEVTGILFAKVEFLDTKDRGQLIDRVLCECGLN